MNLGTLTVETSTLSGNTCTYTGSGGAIYSWQFGGPITIINSTFENNRATMGGGVFAEGVQFSLTNSTLSGNFGGFGATNSGGEGLYLSGVTDWLVLSGYDREHHPISYIPFVTVPKW